MMTRDEYGDWIEVPDEGNAAPYNPYQDPANFAPTDPVTADGGYSTAPPLDLTPGDAHTGPYAPGWAQGPDDLWRFTDPQAKAGGGPPPATMSGLVGYGGPSRPNYGFFHGAPSFNFNGPGAFNFDPFKAPSLADAQNEPGYEFARGEGQRALQQSAAGRGVLRTGGTLKDLIGWGNKFAEQNYGNVFNRAYTGWNANRGNAFDNYKMNYDNAFGLAKAQYEPQFASWGREMDLGKSAADSEFDRQYDAWKYDNPSADAVLNAGRD